MSTKWFQEFFFYDLERSICHNPQQQSLLAKQLKNININTA
jgi:hypothetical protein